METKTPEGTNFGVEKINFLSRSDVDYYDEISVKPDEIANIIDQSIFDREAYVEEKIFRPAVWSAFGMDKEGQDYRACATYGPMYK